MRRSTFWVVLASLCGYTAGAQDIYLGLYYVCNGERVSVQCDPDNKSDSAICSASYPDRPKPRGATITARTTRGAVRKLFATCRPPDPEVIEEDRKDQQRFRESQEKTRRDQEEYRKAHQPPPPGATTDPGTLAARRCAAAGRSLLECLGDGINRTLRALPPGMNPMGKTMPAGLRMNGDFQGPNGITIAFSTGAVYDPGRSIVRCGKVNSAYVPYNIAFKDGQIFITVPNQPRAISLKMHADGKLAGPGPVDVAGQVIVGYKNGGRTASGQQTPPQQWVSKQITASEARYEFNPGDVQKAGDQYYVNVPASQSTFLDPKPAASGGPSPIMEARTEHCSVDSLTPAGSTQQGPSGITGSFEVFAGSTKKKLPVPAGLRMGGAFQGEGGVDLEFHPGLTVLACGEVELAKPYTVEYTGRQVLIKINNDAGPIVLAYQPDGTLAGTGQLRIGGRVMVGQDRNGQLLYAPKVVTCPLQVLTPAR
jgi:hypothetical protein